MKTSVMESFSNTASESKSPIIIEKGTPLQDLNSLKLYLKRTRP